MGVSAAEPHQPEHEGEAHDERLRGRKFFFPRMMKLPVGRYSPVGAVFDTCSKPPGFRV